MIDRILEFIRKEPITISQWMIGFIGIMFVRFFLEVFSNPTTGGVIASDSYTIIHYLLFFIAVSMGLACIVGYFSRDYPNAGKLVLFMLPVVWLAPILDIIFSFGAGYRMSYAFDAHKTLFLNFFKFFSPQFMQWATYGMRIEIIIILLGIGYYIWLKRGKLLQAVLAMLLSYILIFLIGSTPGLLYSFTHIQSGAGSSVLDVFYYIGDLITNSNIFHNTLHETAFSVSPIRFFELGFNKLMSQILFILSFIFLGWWFWKSNPDKFRVIIKNSRFERIIFYLSLLFFGVWLAYLDGRKLSSWIDALGIISMSISWISIWLYSVHINDLSDIDVDKISNPERPITKGLVGVDEMREISYVWLALALFGSWSAGFYPFYFSLIGISVSYIYSTPPLRLKRIPILSAFLISIACLITVLAGFFFVSADKTIQTFPILLSLGILVVFTLGINIKDMKDVDGDRSSGIKTLPTIFGKNGPMIVGLCLALSFILAPIFLSFYLLYIISIPSAIIGYKLITKTPYKERDVFILYFVFLVLTVLLFMIAPLFVG